MGVQCNSNITISWSGDKYYNGKILHLRTNYSINEKITGKIIRVQMQSRWKVIIVTRDTIPHRLPPKKVPCTKRYTIILHFAKINKPWNFESVVTLTLTGTNATQIRTSAGVQCYSEIENGALLPSCAALRSSRRKCCAPDPGTCAS